MSALPPKADIAPFTLWPFQRRQENFQTRGSQGRNLICRL